MWEEKEEGSHDDSSYSKYKIKEGHKFQSSKKNVQGTLHALIKVGRKKKRGVMMKAAIQNTKYKRHKFQSSKKKHSRYTPPTNQVWVEKEDGSKDDSSYSKYKIKETQDSIIKEKHSRYTPSTNQVWEEKQDGVMMKAAIQKTN